jgi:signal transduction histidine kinase
VERSTGLFGLLILVVLVPAAGLLWFMNEALTAQSAAARQSVLDAYRGQLRLVRSRIDAHWKGYAGRLERNGNPEATFTRLVLDGAADGVVLLDADGGIVYPNQAAAQQLLLMEERRRRSPNVSIPTEAALRLSLEAVAAGNPATESGGFRQTPIPDVWSLTSNDRQVVGLYRTGRLEAMMHDALHEVAPEGIIFLASPPGIEADEEAIAAGDWLPGWQLSFMPIDRTLLDAAARSRRTFYLSIGVTGIAIIALLGAAAGGAFRRQLRLARLKTDLVAAVSHELRTPLTSMRVLVDGLLADREVDPAKTREYLALMARETERLSRLIENFLTFSRIERNRQQFVFAPVHPATVVAAAVDAVRDRLPASCELRTDVAPDLPPISADAAAIETALINLLDNALKYTPAVKRIVLRAKRENGTVAFEVQDNGIGIPEREHRRIFRRFYRIERQLSGDTTGVGLGLSIVDLIVRAHGGTIAVRSESGAGSTFTVRLPRVEGEAAA